MDSDEEYKKSAVKWSNFYAIRKNEIAEKDINDLFNKYNISEEDKGRFSAAMYLLATKEIISRKSRRF